MNRDQRNELLAEIEDLRRRGTGPDADRLTLFQVRALGQRRKDLKQQYFDQLPSTPITRCPITDAVVTKKIDTFGLDGPWWSVNHRDDNPTGSPFVLFYQGAVRTAGEPLPAELDSTARILLGPETPFIVPRVLGLQDVQCVISSPRLASVPAPVYLMTYFRRPVLKGADLHANWLRECFYYADARGAIVAKISNDAWDFDLAPWIDQGKVAWIEPGDESLRLVRGPAARCPYVRLPGERAMQELSAKGLRIVPAPDGAEVGFDELFD